MALSGLRSRRLRPFGLYALAALGVLLTGCSSERYLMVPKDNLNTLSESVQSQRATLVTMEGNAAVRQDQLLSQQKANTDTILSAIAEKIQKPQCPPVRRQKACPTAADFGRAASLNGKMVVGQIEKFYLAGPGLIYSARIDSGAETSSLDARNITRFERDGTNWVRFDVPVPGEDGKFVTMEKEISRKVRILQASSDEAERRVVVDLQFAIGNHQQSAEFTLTNRKDLDFPVLVGRNVLQDVMVIDVGKKFATQLPEKLTQPNGDGS
ncbi:ATP-dependent zinc protease family protein [Marinobacter sp. C2H3]|uniref:ATP-dependent zinc protease family protein n=1 Tax=Marinobacter sp. C2H3 TaxID=3119003 RepID=UPI00300F1AD6